MSPNIMTSTFGDRLRKEQELFMSLRTGDKYKKLCMPEVLGYLKEYMQSGAFPYNRQVADYIRGRETVPVELIDHLETEVYLAQQVRHDQEQQQFDSEQEKQGYTKITPTTISAVKLLVGSRVLLKIDKRADMFGGISEITCRVIVDADEKPFFIPLRNRRRGFSANGFAIGMSGNGYYKQVLKATK